ncbi:MAG: hypothetical protein DRJ49_05865 [Thermoprotei archaeon]|nr:MAG: hypothetical protein DRJ49_05865 [Thermoprotei archaeon]
MKAALLKDKGLALLGDSIVNFLASAIMTLTRRKPCGIKVPDRLLVRVAEEIGVRERLKGFSREEISNAIEAMFAILWLRDKLDLERAIKDAVMAISRESPSTNDDLVEGLKYILSTYGKSIIEQLNP